ncbi:hypothetical protein ASPACDRAFT_43011 [Aspergillus aculeatus ATCC 16872]|uniref:Uncharacterized protein n=1 Tax=Aspergillus aculeatus (strain ATCC 16872 / CBS 172.66 / WB 5094) TaxID=690307 RepID=A0A1L9WWB3_ASPA1|nr:uncharacterized protein ASPACDRAFT_43011 [Aspergillus aculeatus ATCC 16872]OJK00424.1 hypothetical protein ASPACDRAFT_43011 [Aspergillus aculeatus ATCC 16872]
MSLSVRSSASLASYSGTIFQTQISPPPQYTPDKDFEYQTRFDVRARKRIDDVASRHRICPSPEAIWCPMGAMGQDFLVDAECHKRILWYAYQRFTSTMSCPTARGQVYIHPSPTLAVRPVAHGFHDEVGLVPHPSDNFPQQQNSMIRFSASTVWASAAAREEWYADFADQAAHCYERLGYIVDWVQLVAESAESVILELEPVDAEVIEWWKSGRHQAMSR